MLFLFPILEVKYAFGTQKEPGVVGSQTGICCVAWDLARISWMCIPVEMWLRFTVWNICVLVEDVPNLNCC